MSSIEVLSGDFEPGAVRIRYSPAGRAYMRLTSRDGYVEDLFLETDVVACFDSSEGRVGEKLKRWAVDHGIRETAGRATGLRAERVFAIMLKDGRRIVGRSTADVVAEFKSAAGIRSATPQTPAPAAMSSMSGRFSGLVTRLFAPRH